MPGLRSGATRGEALYRPLFLFLGLLASMILLLVAGFVVLHGHLSPTSVMIMVAALVSLYVPSQLPGSNAAGCCAAATRRPRSSSTSSNAPAAPSRCGCAEIAGL